MVAITLAACEIFGACSARHMLCTLLGSFRYLQREDHSEGFFLTITPLAHRPCQYFKSMSIHAEKLHMPC